MMWLFQPPDPPSDLVQDQQLSRSMTPAANRLDVLRRALDEIRNTIIFLDELEYVRFFADSL